MSTYDPETIHCVDSGAQSPAWNMAVDDALLAARNDGRLPGTWIRLFAWEPWAITLGRLQDVDEELDTDLLRQAGVEVVRRATGGKAVFHATELTYSIIGGLADRRWGTTLHETYRVVTDLVAAGLAELGIATQLAPGRRETGGAGGDGTADLRAACFAVAFGHELVHEGRKICGSAQRRLIRAFLQHGSLLLGPEHARLAEWVRTDRNRAALRRRLLADSTDVATALGRAISYEEVSAALLGSLRARFGSRLVIDRLPPAIEDEARRDLDRVRVPIPARTG